MTRPGRPPRRGCPARRWPRSCRRRWCRRGRTRCGSAMPSGWPRRGAVDMISPARPVQPQQQVEEPPFSPAPSAPRIPMRSPCDRQRKAEKLAPAVREAEIKVAHRSRRRERQRWEPAARRRGSRDCRNCHRRNCRATVAADAARLRPGSPLAGAGAVRRRRADADRSGCISMAVRGRSQMLRTRGASAAVRPRRIRRTAFQPARRRRRGSAPSRAMPTASPTSVKVSSSPIAASRRRGGSIRRAGQLGEHHREGIADLDVGIAAEGVPAEPRLSRCALFFQFCSG